MKLMKSFQRGEKGFTLVELLIVVAILGILAAVVIPNVVGLLGRGGKQAYETDLETVQLAAATFFADIHDGFNAGADGSFGNYTDNRWGDTTGNDTSATTPGHYYPTSIGTVTGHILYPSVDSFDPDQANSAVLLEADDDAADDADVQNHAIWMGLLVNAAYDVTVSQPDGTTNRWTAAPLNGMNALYLNELPNSAMTGNLYNGDPGTGKSGGYCWIVGKNGVVYGVYRLTNVDPTGATFSTGTYWFAGYSGAYP